MRAQAHGFPVVAAVVVLLAIVVAGTLSLDRRAERGPAAPASARVPKPPAVPPPLPDETERAAPGESIESVPDAPSVPREARSIRIRLIDAETGKSVAGTRRASVVVRGPGESADPFGAPLEGGRVVLPLPARDAGRIEVRIPGYEPVTIPAKDLVDGREFPVVPRTPLAVGRLSHPAVLHLLRHDRGGDLPPVRRTSDRAAGAFRRNELPAGRYEAELVSESEGRLVRKKLEIVVGGGTVDLGEIDFAAAAGVRARVVDEADRWIPQADVVVVRTEEDPEQARRVEPGKGGWVEYADMEPGLVHRVVALGLPGPLETRAATPDADGETRTVELRWPGRLTLCRLRFDPLVLDVLHRAALRGGRSVLPVPAGRLEFGESAVEMPLLPGAYEVRLGDRVAVLRVPAADRWEAEPELRKRER